MFRMHDVATFLVRRDHRLARDLQELIELEYIDAATDPGRCRRLEQLRFALDAALADWFPDDQARGPASTVPRTVPRTTTRTTVRLDAASGV